MTSDPEKLIAGCVTVAAKIRALDAAGYPRAEIARMLGKRYQHVRNVLEEPKAATLNVYQAPPGLAEADTKPFQHAIPHTYWLEVGANGSVILPPEVLDALGARPGGMIIADLGEESFTLISGMTGIQRMKARLAQHSPPGAPMSEELIEDRRREAAIDELEAQMDEARMRRGG
uniref:SpoVT-AbrB domain-containing protein n=1 Tax=Caulobacter sp. (strain K31) TaxID=366602 RepID=B0SW82_CAUSK